MRYIYRFKEANLDDEDHIGKQAAILCHLALSSIPLPQGFIVSSNAYDAFFRENNLKTKIEHLLSAVEYSRPESLIQTATTIKKIIHDTPLPEGVASQILSSYHALSSPLSEAVVSLEVSESETWQHSHPSAASDIDLTETVGESNLIYRIKDIWSSHFSAMSLQLQHEHYNDHLPHGCAVIVEEKTSSETSGIMLTADPVRSDKSTMKIEAIFGDIAFLKSGKITPDHYLIEKSQLRVLSSTQSPQTVLLKKSGLETKEVLISEKEGRRQKLSEDNIQKLARLGKKIEELFITPQAIEWTGYGNKLLITRTQTLSLPQKEAAKQKSEKSDIKEALIASGIPSSKGIVTGPARLVTSLSDAQRILRGDIVVLSTFAPSMQPFLKKAGGVILENGGSMSNLSFFSRELGIPAVSGVKNAMKLFRFGKVIRLDGEKGIVLHPHLTNSTAEKPTSPPVQTASKIYINLPEKKLLTDSLISQTDGLGLLPSEVLIKSIGVHPKKMVQDGKSEEYSNQIAHEVAVYCRSFSPLPVIFRTSDLTTKEYRSLTGGKEFEPVEENPLLGFRGAYRYIHDPQTFALELEAVKTVRNKMNLRNLWLTIPFIRTPKELREVKKLIASSGLYRSPSFKLFMMVELPSNILLIDKFIQEGIDGVMLDADDLTKIILGTDFENSEVSKETSIGSDAVRVALEHVIKTSRRLNIESFIHFQTPVIHQEFLENSISWGVSGVSIPHQAVDTTRSIIAKVETNLIS